MVRGLGVHMCVSERALTRACVVNGGLPRGWRTRASLQLKYINFKENNKSSLQNNCAEFSIMVV